MDGLDKTLMPLDRTGFRRLWRPAAGWAVPALVCLAALSAAAQAPQPSEETERAADPLAARQQIVRDRMVQLEDRMFRLAEKLTEGDPEQARRLADALRNAGELLIRRNMEEAIELLEQAQLADAAERQVAIENALEQVLKVLLEEPDLSKELQKEIERLKALAERVDKLLEQQRELEAKTRDPAGRLAVAAARLQRLIARQQAEIAKGRAAAAGEQPAGDLAESQAEVRRDAESLAEELKAIAGEEPEPAEPAPPEPGEHEGHDHREQEAAAQASRQASAAIERAAGEMKSAEAEFQQSRSAEAGAAQERAMEALREAMEAMKGADQAPGPSPDAAQDAGRQRELEKQASKLADEMQGRESPSGTQPAETQDPGDQTPPEPGERAEAQPENQDPNGEQAEQPPAPGGQNVRNASGHMNRAAGNLDRNQPAQANQDQQRAIEELQRAQDELRQTLDQLRREQQEEMLRGLEQRFRAMLAGQKTVNEATDALAARDRETWTRSDLLNLAGLAQDEKKLGEEADAALNLLVEEATTVVFPQVVANMRSDMLDVARRLGERDTGETTRRIEGDIITTLEELIEAVKQRQSEMADAPPPGGQQGNEQNPSGQQDNPLLPSSAELKLLKSSQVRVNRQTRGFEEAHPDTGPLSPEARRELERLAARQEALADMARQMHERETGR